VYPTCTGDRLGRNEEYALDMLMVGADGGAFRVSQRCRGRGGVSHS